MGNNIKNVGSYTIVTTQGVEKGIFWRSSIQEVTFTTEPLDMGLSAYNFITQNKNILKRFFQVLIGNKYIVKHAQEWEENDDGSWAGFSANIICFPIYFKRKFRKLRAYSSNRLDNIQSIVSCGYESKWESCSGHCKIERTKITLNNGRVIKSRCYGSYQNTYTHIVERVISK